MRVSRSKVEKPWREGKNPGHTSKQEARAAPSKQQLGIHVPQEPTPAALTAKERLDMLYKKAQQEELANLKHERQKLDDALNSTSGGAIDFYGNDKLK